MQDLNSILSNDDNFQNTGSFEKKYDGIYRVDLKKAEKGQYKATLRFLPNISVNDDAISSGPAIVEKHVHYVNIPNAPELTGYYDCQKVLGDNKCSLCEMYWKFKNSKDVTEQEKAAWVQRSRKYYAYVYVIEDNQNPDWVGKIMVFPFGKKIHDKIALEKSGEISGVECKVHDLATGKDFRLIAKEIGGYVNYDDSQFLSQAPLKKIDGKAIPTYEKDGKILIGNSDSKKDKEIQEKIVQFLVEREADLESFSPKVWEEDRLNKVNLMHSALFSSNLQKNSKAPTNISSDPFSSENPFEVASKKTKTPVFSDSFDDEF